MKTPTRRAALGLLSSSALTAACASMPGAAPSADAAFARISADMLDGMARTSPIFATWLGDHRFDDQIDDLSAEGRRKARAARAGLVGRIENLDHAALSPDNKVDAAMAQNALSYAALRDEGIEDWAWDPMVYAEAAGGALYTLMARDFAPLPQRLLNASARMEKLPDLFAAMRANLDPARSPALHFKTARAQFAGINSIIDDLIVKQAAGLGPGDRAKIERSAQTLKAALNAHDSWFAQNEAKASSDARLPPAQYESKLMLALNTNLTPEQIYAQARSDIAATRAEMEEIARRALGRSAPRDAQDAIKMALEKAYAERPARSDVVAACKASLERSTKFVRDRDLMTLPDAPVDVILMPEFQRGVAVAYCDSPGPMDRYLKTFYAVSPIPDAWTEAQTTSFLREYNLRSIEELTIHEAMPGHYVQIWHANRHPSVLRAALSSGTFVEGWACYAQDMMSDEGYYGADPLGPLINRKWRLRLISNAILDQGIYTQGWSREEAMRLMTHDAFQEEREAAGKWNRALLTSAQLSTYFVGWVEHRALRKEAERKWGAGFSLKRYHDAVCAHGSPTAAAVRALMFA
jgi:uncharacterized protein (DUF885 family)